MTEHPTDLLLQIADGATPPADARAHLAACQRCHQTLEALAPLDLGYVWEGVAAELDAPRPGLLERLLVAVGVGPGLARFCAVTPSLRLGWLVANTVLAGVVDLALGGGGPRAGWLLPMCAAALLAVLVASWQTPAIGAFAGMGAWALVLAGWKLSQQPVAWLTGPGAQAAYAAVAVVLLALLIRRMAREGWALADQAEPA